MPASSSLLSTVSRTLPLGLEKEQEALVNFYVGLTYFTNCAGNHCSTAFSLIQFFHKHTESTFCDQEENHVCTGVR